MDAQSLVSLDIPSLVSIDIPRRFIVVLSLFFIALNFKFINIFRGSIVTSNQKMAFVSISFYVIISKPLKHVVSAFL